MIKKSITIYPNVSDCVNKRLPKTSVEEYAIDRLAYDEHFWEEVAETLKTMDDEVWDKLINAWDDVNDVIPYVKVYPDTITLNKSETMEIVDDCVCLAFDVIVGFDEKKFDKEVA